MRYDEGRIKHPDDSALAIRAKPRRCAKILNFDTPPAMFFCLNELMAAAVAASAMSVAMFIAVVMVASASATVGGL